MSRTSSSVTEAGTRTVSLAALPADAGAVAGPGADLGAGAALDGAEAVVGREQHERAVGAVGAPAVLPDGELRAGR
ncbi:MAG: hypothetical protein R3F59_31685 [Myxococcota bacterium]